MKRTLALVVMVFALVASFSGAALALTCPSGQVVWIEAYNSADGSYKQVYWQGGSRYFSGWGTDYIDTNRQANAFATVASDSSTKWASQYCVPEDVELTWQ